MAAAASTSTLSTLLSRTDITDHEEVLNAANAAFKKSKADSKAQQVRIVALLKLDRFDDAIRAIEEGGDGLKEQLPLEHAYALYKSGDLKQAQQVAEQALKSKDGRGIRHVLAQTTYRLENFQHAAQLYQHLATRSGEDEENDLRINGGAVDAQLEWNGQGYLVKKKKPAREDLEAFESAYNAACGSIARCEFGQGEVLLKRAKDLCAASEELSDAEKQAELLPIMVQRAYVLVRQGRAEEAEKEMNSLGLSDSMSEISDMSTRHVAKVNALASSKEDINPFLVQRMFQQSSNIPKSDALFTYQSSVLKQDAHVLDLQCLKSSGVASSTQAAISKEPAPTTSGATNMLSVLNAAAHSRPATAVDKKASLKVILPLLEVRPNDVGLILTIVQLYVLTHNYASATILLEKFLTRLEQSGSASDLDVRYAPGLIGTLVSLYSSQGRRGPIKSHLSRATAYWREKYKEDGISQPPSTNLAKAAGKVLLESGEEADARAASNIFSDLLKHDSADRSAIAGLVAAQAVSDPSKLDKQHLDSLTPVQRLIAGIDAEALEEAGIPHLPTSASSAVSSKKRKMQTTDSQPKPAKKTKKPTPSRVPKNFEEG